MEQVQEVIAQYIYDNLLRSNYGVTYTEAEFSDGTFVGNSTQDSYFKANSIASGVIDHLKTNGWEIRHA